MPRIPRLAVFPQIDLPELQVSGDGNRCAVEKLNSRLAVRAAHEPTDDWARCIQHPTLHQNARSPPWIEEKILHDAIEEVPVLRGEPAAGLGRRRIDVRATPNHRQ